MGGEHITLHDFKIGRITGNTDELIGNRDKSPSGAVWKKFKTKILDTASDSSRYGIKV
ncbi:hypothetical protein VIAQ111709_13940 [Vibrio aquimaris]|uniref:Uncharacterized protein n=1 Tax=Vibrio aquimaris TaxID=2587862 RepID=A0A5P9CMZ8_9VIBR|nr:hypothetical protein FIV01_14880 [Vibrio aquimaris]